MYKTSSAIALSQQNISSTNRHIWHGQIPVVYHSGKTATPHYARTWFCGHFPEFISESNFIVSYLEITTPLIANSQDQLLETWSQPKKEMGSKPAHNHYFVFRSHIKVLQRKQVYLSHTAESIRKMKDHKSLDQQCDNQPQDRAKTPSRYIETA